MSLRRLYLVLLFLAAPSLVLADYHCGFRTYSAPTYSYSAPVTYSAPTYYPSYDRVLLVPQIQKVYDRPDYYYSLGDSYRDALLADAIAFRVMNAQRGNAPAPAYVPRIPEATPGGQYPAPSGPSGAAPRLPTMPPASPELGAATVPAKLPGIVQTSCLKCHNGAQANGIDLSNLAAVPLAQRDKVLRKVVTKEMPKGGTLAEADLDAFVEWSYLAEAAEKQARR